MPLIAIEPYELQQEDTDITQADTTASVWGPLFSYRAPKGRSLILRPGDPFSVYMVDTGTTECSDTDLLRLVKKNQTGEEIVPITGDILYASVKGSFQDVDKMFRLPLTREIEIAEQEYLVFECYSVGLGGDKDLSYFSLVSRSKRTGG